MDNEPTKDQPGAISPRRTKRTEINYLSRYKSIEKAALKRINYYNQEEEYWEGIYADPKDMVDQLEIYAQTHKTAAVAQYKSAVLFRFNQILKEADQREHSYMLDQIKRASNVFAQIEGNYSKQDNSTRKRYIPEKDLEKLRSALAIYRKNKLVGVNILAWVDATLITGLRPNEWEDAVIEMLDDPENGITSPHLITRNSKRKAAAPAFYDLERARAENPGLEIQTVFDMERLGIHSTIFQRELSRSISLNEDEMGIVQKHIDYIARSKAEGETFQQYYDSCRRLLERVCIEVFKGKKSYSLYSMRHQYAANGKKIFTREELARRMGHDSIQTAEKAYASGRFAHKAFKDENSQTMGQAQPDQATETLGNMSNQ